MKAEQSVKNFYLITLLITSRTSMGEFSFDFRKVLAKVLSAFTDHTKQMNV